MAGWATLAPIPYTFCTLCNYKCKNVHSPQPRRQSLHSVASLLNHLLYRRPWSSIEAFTKAPQALPAALLISLEHCGRGHRLGLFSLSCHGG